jgi:hypothetical protein
VSPFVTSSVSFVTSGDDEVSSARESAKAFSMPTRIDWIVSSALGVDSQSGASGSKVLKTATSTRLLTGRDHR